MTTQQWPTRAPDRAAVSFNPENMSEGGLPLDKVDGKITNSHFHPFDYPNAAGQPSAPVSVVLSFDISFQDQQTGETKTQVQKYSVGSPEIWQISPDGFAVAPLSDGQKINKNANIGMLMSAFRSCGFPQQALELNDARVFNNVVAYWEQKDQPDRAGLSNTRVDARGQERKRQTPMPTALRTTVTPDFVRANLSGMVPAQAAAVPAATRGRGATKAAAPVPFTPAAAPAPAPEQQAPALSANGTGPAVDEAAVIEVFQGVLQANGNLTPQNLRLKSMAAFKERKIDVKAVAAAYRTEQQMADMGGGEYFQVAEQNGQKVITLVPA